MINETDQQTLKEFKEAVNLTPKKLAEWLETDESKSVGYKAHEGDESIGHEMGGEIVALLGKKQADYNEEDFKRMKKIVGYVHRHLAQRPDGDVTNTRWRYSLMNWGHDPNQQ